MKADRDNICNVSFAESEVLLWLLEEKEPSVRYRTITELLGRQISQEENCSLKKAIYESKAVQKIFAKIILKI